MQGEGPSIFSPSEGHYYLMASHLTYWRPNPPMLYHAAAASLASAKWNKLAIPAQGASANTTFNSQSSSVFTLALQGGGAMHMYMGDRWNFYGPGTLRYRAPALDCLLPFSATAAGFFAVFTALMRPVFGTARLDLDCYCLGCQQCKLRAC